jgi:hypothetical protein
MRALFLAVAQNEGKATVIITLKLALPPFPDFYSLSFQPLSPPAVSRGRLSSYPFPLHCHVPLPLLYWTSCCSRSTVIVRLYFSLRLLHELMGRKLSAEEYNRTAAQNGWVQGGL